MVDPAIYTNNDIVIIVPATCQDQFWQNMAVADRYQVAL